MFPGPDSRDISMLCKILFVTERSSALFTIRTEGWNEKSLLIAEMLAFFWVVRKRFID